MKNKLLNLLLKIQMVNLLLKSNEWLVVTRNKESEDPKFCHGELSGDTLKRITGYIRASVDLQAFKNDDNE